MEWGGPFFVLGIIAISTIGWLGSSWIRARHGYPLEDEWGGKTLRADDAVTERLRDENERLKVRLEASEDRLAVLERIVTDRGFSVAAQIEALRDEPAAPRARSIGDRS
ncbi:MAG: hypothetical protein B7Z33_06320 [Sphingomonadales bacterium 12-68-11]|nr:MAG: hypothetical protein B7Z33_06320 [Sphingomonadales bacterium 12-68-11]